MAFQPKRTQLLDDQQTKSPGLFGVRETTRLGPLFPGGLFDGGRTTNPGYNFPREGIKTTGLLVVRETASPGPYLPGGLFDGREMASLGPAFYGTGTINPGQLFPGEKMETPGLFDDKETTKPASLFQGGLFDDGRTINHGYNFPGEKMKPPGLFDDRETTSPGPAYYGTGTINPGQTFPGEKMKTPGLFDVRGTAGTELPKEDMAQVARTDVPNPLLHLTLGKGHPALREVEKRLRKMAEPRGKWLASSPLMQFQMQDHKEFDRLCAERRDPNNRPHHQGDGDLLWLSEQNVKKRWVEQGIWNHKWKMCMGKWKHEEPLDLDSDPEDDEDDIEARAGPFGDIFRPASPPCRGLFRRRPEPKPPKSAEEMAKRVAVRKVEREASRPFHQFLYQVSKEREQIEETTTPSPHDINTIAYERVKELWTRQSLWNENWGILPGMSWQHEQPFEEFLRELKDYDPACEARDAQCLQLISRGIMPSDDL
ncbi:hypothetical protein AK830_g11034 [Neonectria ditissima]|uniref:Uncharacterized protein n=1 Tax=Neonectria ditissima TaxID=78410 RepID=A0A0P7B5V1_9HYPO|nr:hypothetical protein AK830_g11034 [Neonectria ditissima]